MRQALWTCGAISAPADCCQQAGGEGWGRRELWNLDTILLGPCWGLGALQPAGPKAGSTVGSQKPWEEEVLPWPWHPDWSQRARTTTQPSQPRSRCTIRHQLGSGMPMDTLLKCKDVTLPRKIFSPLPRALRIRSKFLTGPAPSAPPPTHQPHRPPSGHLRGPFSPGLSPLLPLWRQTA